MVHGDKFDLHVPSTNGKYVIRNGTLHIVGSSRYQPILNLFDGKFKWNEIKMQQHEMIKRAKAVPSGLPAQPSQPSMVPASAPAMQPSAQPPVAQQFN